MRTFNVTIAKTDYYVVEIEAEDEDSAEEQAEDISVDVMEGRLSTLHIAWSDTNIEEIVECP